MDLAAGRGDVWSGSGGVVGRGGDGGGLVGSAGGRLLHGEVGCMEGRAKRGGGQGRDVGVGRVVEERMAGGRGRARGVEGIGTGLGRELVHGRRPQLDDDAVQNKTEAGAVHRLHTNQFFSFVPVSYLTSLFQQKHPCH